MMRIALDSNVLVYAAGGERSSSDRAKVEQSLTVVTQLLPVAELVAPVQALGEALRVLVRKLAKTPEAIAATISSWDELFDKPPTTFALLRTGSDLAHDHRLQQWDAVIVAVAADARCSILLSEDMQDGFVWRGMTIINPFAATPHPLLASLLVA